jgi:hypothetical protein
MPDQTDAPRSARLDRRTQARLGTLLRCVHLPPETGPIPDDQVDLLLALRRRDRERRRDR